MHHMQNKKVPTLCTVQIIHVYMYLLCTEDYTVITSFPYLFYYRLKYLTHRLSSQGWAFKCPIIYFFPVSICTVSFLPTSALASVLCIYFHICIMNLPQMWRRGFHWYTCTIFLQSYMYLPPYIFRARFPCEL